MDPAPYNPKEANEKKIRALMASLKEDGVPSPVVLNERKGGRLVIVDGHQRVQAAKRLGLKRLPARLVKLSPSREKRLNLALNNPTGRFVDKQLAELVTGLKAENLDLTMTGFSDRELDNLLGSLEGSGRGPRGWDDRVIQAPEEPSSKMGEVYELGPHRLMCGDATRPVDIEKLLEPCRGEIDVLVTDPPYGVQPSAGWLGGERLVARDDTVAGGERVDWSKALQLVGAPVLYVWHDARPQCTVEAYRGLEAIGYQIRQQIVWRKSQLVMGRYYYHWQHESCVFASRPKQSLRWRGGRKQSTVWEAESPNLQVKDGEDRSSTHPTQKPLSLFETPILNHTEAGGRVCDPFAGAGTALIAAEKHGRICYAMELEPKWCDVIRQRYSLFVNDRAKGTT
jgi:DNA modification methylase